MNKLTEQQEKRFDDKFTTGIGGVLVSRGGTSVVSEEVKQFLADEIAGAREEVKAQGLTRKKWAVLDFYSNFYTQNGYYPTLEVVRESFGYANTSSVQRHTDVLKQKGLLTFEKTK